MPMIANPRFDLLTAAPGVLLANIYPFMPGERIGPMRHNSCLFLLCIRGSGSVQVGVRQFELHAEQLVHVPIVDTVGFAAARDDPFALIGLHLSFSSDGAPPLAVTHVEEADRARAPVPEGQPFLTAFLADVPADSPLLDAAMRIAQIHEEATEHGATASSAARLRGLALYCLGELERCAQPPGPAPARRARQARIVREITSFMELHLDKPALLRRASLARRAGVSEAVLVAAFHVITAKAPVDYLIDLRLRRAQRLLRTTRLQIAEIAAAVGIADVYYFAKLFKRRVGCTATHYRTRLRI